MAISEWEIRRAAVGREGIRIILCDDDPAFGRELRSALEHIFARLNRNAAITAFSAPGEIPEKALETCEMAFFDIDFETGDQNGIDAARRLRSRNRRALIFFVTNYIDYAPAGYEVQAFRYILKRDLGEVLERYLLQAMETMAEGQSCLRLRSREQTIDLPLEQISYIEVLDHSVSIHAGERTFTMSATLSSLEREMEAHGFLRLHKSYLVNMSHIRKFRSRECLLADGTSLSVSEKNYSQQKQKYLIWKGLS